MKKWTIKLEQDPDGEDLLLPLPQEVMDLLGWKEGDTLIWDDTTDGTYTLRKKNEIL